MNTTMDLVGKTISGVVASPGTGGARSRIWLLQFSDGTHVEFVSPGAQRELRKLAAGRVREDQSTVPDPQLALNVA